MSEQLCDTRTFCLSDELGAGGDVPEHLFRGLHYILENKNVDIDDLPQTIEFDADEDALFACRVKYSTKRGAMSENEANRANFDEIRGHLDIIKAKLVNPEFREQRRELLENQEDYYERALQLRIMQNKTLLEELKEKMQQLDLLSSYMYRAKYRLLVIGVVAVAMAIELSAPGMWWFIFTAPTLQNVLSHIVFAAAVLAVAAMLWR